MSYTTLVKRIKTPGANPDVDYDNDGQEWVSVQAYLDYMDGEGAEIPLKKTLVITPQNGQRYEVWNPESARTFVPKVMAHTHSYDDLENKPTIPVVNDSEIVFTHDGKEVGRMTTNQSAGKTIEVGEGEERVFTAPFLKKVLTCRMNKEVYLTSGSVVSPNMVKYNGLPEPGSSSTAWCGAGVEPTAAANTRIIIHNVNVDAWKGRTFTFTVKEGMEFAIASGEVIQNSQWDKSYPQTSDIAWNWHTHSDPVTIEIKDMISIMFRNAGNDTFNWAYSYTAMWEWFEIEEVTGTSVVKIPPRKLKDDRYVGYRVGVLGDSILAGASTKAYKTALDVLVSDYGIVPVPRCIAGSCIAPTSAAYSRDDIRFKNRVELNWQFTSLGYNGAENGVNRPYDKTLGVLIYCVNDVLMDKVKLDANAFVLVTDQTTGCQEWQIDNTALDAEGYVASLIELEGIIKSGAGSSLNHFFLVGPYKCTWPGAYPMSTTGVNPNGNTGEDYIRAQRKLAMIKGWSYLDLLSSQLNTSYNAMSNDKLHPSQEGHQLLGDILGQMLCGTLLTQASGIFTDVDDTKGSDNVEDIETLKKSVQLANETLDAEVELSMNGYIDASTHEYVENNDYRCSGFVYVRGAKTIEYKTRSLGDSYHMCFYDKDKNSISALDFPVASGGVQGTIDLTDNTYADVYYIIMSAYSGGYPPYLRIKGKFDFSKALTEGEIKTSHGVNVFNPSDIELSTRLGADGTLATGYDKHMVSGLIEVSSGSSTLYFKNLPIVSGATDARYLIWYDSSKAYLSGTTITGTEATAVLSIPANAKYFRFSVYQNVTIPQTYLEDINSVMVSFTDADFTPFKETIKSIGKHTIVPDFIDEEYTKVRAITDNPLTHILREPGYGSIIHHWGFIGDSLSSGEMMGGQTPIDCYEYSWGQRFCKLVGVEGYCFSHGGCSTAGWLAGGTDHRLDNPPYAGGAQGGGWSVAKESGMKKQAYIIALGINDMIAETPVGSTDDYREYDPENDTEYGPNSFCSHYMQIINRLKYIQPNAKIFLMTTPPKGLWSYPAIDEAVRDIYEYYQDIYPGDIFLIDIARYLTADLMGGMFNLGSHGSAAGYQYFAYVVNTYIDWIIRNNGADFRSVAIDCGYPADYNQNSSYE